MPTLIQPGALLRRGTDRLTNEQLVQLVENPKEVENLCEAIEKRRKAYLATETQINAATKELEAAQAKLVSDRELLVRDQAALAQSVTKHNEVKASEQDGFRRRARELDKREASATEMTAAAERKQEDAESLQRKRETEYATREADLDTRDAALDKREAVAIEGDKKLNGARAQIRTLKRIMLNAVNQVDAGEETDG